MNYSPAFWVAFWAGVAAPGSLYTPSPSYRPQITYLTPGDAFAHVGYTLGLALAAITDERSAQTPAADTAGEPSVSAQG